MKLKLYLFFLCLISCSVMAKQETLNIYAWSGEIPDEIITQFEKESGIHVNITTYENNEMMYAKMRASRNPGYDIVMPSSYFVDRMHKQNMLEPLEKTKLSNWKNLNPEFLHAAYDPDNAVSMPYLWGVTGIFFNDQYYQENTIQKWGDLWNKAYANQLLMLDDNREVFSIALISLGYSPNDTDKEHIKQAFLKLKALMQNVKVFSSDTVVSIVIDEDANLGAVWNGDAYKASLENKAVRFTYPTDGFVIWVDNFAIPITAPHKENAYLFLDFILRADIAKRVALITHYPTANLAAQKLLPRSISENPIIYPPKKILQRGTFQTDLGDETLALYETYWEQLKMGI